jgi:hypothetical protein
MDGSNAGSPIGVKGIGEIGLVGIAAAIANAVYHATGRRIRCLPITIDQLLRPVRRSPRWASRRGVGAEPHWCTLVAAPV